MNLIDILKRILRTKNEIKDIIVDNDLFTINDDFSTYSINVYNYLAQKYNAGYVEGWNNYISTNYGTVSYTEGPLTYKSQTYVNDSSYDPYTVEGLTDIMRSVLSFRENIRDEIAEFNSLINDSFITYPQYLRLLSTTLYEAGLSDGENAAIDSRAPEIPVLDPLFVGDGTSSFTLYPNSSQVGEVDLYFNVDGGADRKYYDETSHGVDISEVGEHTIYYWARRGNTISNNDKYYLSATITIESTLPDGSLPLSPTINFIDGLIYISDNNGDGSSLEYCINYSTSTTNEWKSYEYPLPISDSIEKIASRSYYRMRYSNPTVREIPTTERPPEEPSFELVVPEKVIAYYDSDSGLITLTCASDDASIYYNINGSSGYILYESPFSKPAGSVGLYLKSEIDYGVYGIKKNETYQVISSNSSVPEIEFSDNGLVTITVPNYNNGGILSWVTSSSSSVPLSGWSSQISSQVWFNLTSNRWIHAKYSYNGVETRTVSRFYDWFAKSERLASPTYSVENNYIRISSPYTIYYTLDGSDPRNKQNLWDSTLQQNGLPVIENTVTLKAVAYSEDGGVNWSEVCSWIINRVDYNPDGSEVDYSLEFFAVEGASRIDIDNAKLYYSYDKSSWEEFSYISGYYSVSGLDPTRKVYLMGAAQNDLIGTFSFRGDEIIVSGNVYSLYYAGLFSEAENQNLEHASTALFKGCSNLVSATNLYFPNKVGAGFSETFSGCTNLVYAPKTLNFTTVEPYGLEKMFYECYYLTSTPLAIISEIQNWGMSYTFYRCFSLERCNIRFDIEKIYEYGLEYCFSSCTHLSDIDFEIKSDCVFVQDESYRACWNTFSDTYQFGDMSSKIRLNALSIGPGAYEDMFKNSGIQVFGSLPATSIDEDCYYSSFEGCSSLSSFGSIDTESVYQNSCRRMFYGCSSLVSSPTLKAASLISADNCYTEMFRGCSSLNRIKALFLTSPNINSNYPYTWYWVDGVAEEGVFIQDADASWFDTGVSSIPIGWVVQGSGSNETGAIESISLNSENKVVIITTSDNWIEYQLNGTSGEWSRYTGPFSLNSYSGTVYARCVNNHGDRGAISSKTLTISNLPSLGILVNENIVSVVNPDNYYSKIVYRFLNYETHTERDDSSWKWYQSPISLSEDICIQVIGQTSEGMWGEVYTEDIDIEEILSIPSPTISFNINTNTVSISTTTGFQTWYKIGSNGSWNPYTGAWILSEGENYYVYSYYKDPTTGRVSDTISNKYVTWYEPLPLDAPTISCSNNIITISTEYGDGVVIKWGIGQNLSKSEITTTYSEPIEISTNTWISAYYTYSGQDSYISRLFCEYEEEQDFENRYFTIEVVGVLPNAQTRSITLNTSNLIDNVRNGLYYRINSGTWNSLTIINYINDLNYGDIIEFKNEGPGPAVLPLNGLINYQTWNTSSRKSFIETFGIVIDVYGNISSLIKENFTDTYTPTAGAFAGIFYQGSGIEVYLQSAKNLVLPTTLSNNIFKSMFYNQYYSFNEAPALPATTLRDNCYEQMFRDCTKLTTAPDLPATTLRSNCYKQMFYGCTRLNHVKCLSSNGAGGNCETWLYGVANSGTFIKNSSATWSSGSSGIPNGWNVENA